MSEQTEQDCPAFIIYGGARLTCQRTDSHRKHETTTGNGYPIRWGDEEMGQE